MEEEKITVKAIKGGKTEEFKFSPKTTMKEAVKEVCKTVGFTSPIVLDENNKELDMSHGDRLLSNYPNLTVVKHIQGA